MSVLGLSTTTHKSFRIACLCVSVLTYMLNMDPNQGSYKYQEGRVSEENRIEGKLFISILNPCDCKYNT